MADVEPSIRNIVERVYDLLVRGQYVALANLTKGVRLSATEIEKAVLQYPYSLKHWPDRVPIDAIEVKDASPRAWSIRADAYTSEEGRSDLSLEMTLIEHTAGQLTVEFDDLHVL
jgi:hypothetical protein